MKIQRSVLGEGVAGITLTGEFDSFAANPFLEQVEAIVQSGVTQVVANLRLVLFINSTAIGSLIKARKRVRGLGGELTVSEPSKRVKDALDALGLSQVIQCFDSDDEALDHLTRTAGEAVEVPSENSVLVTFPDSAGKVVAKMASLEENGIHFTASAEAARFQPGTELKVKFRLPLFRQAYYFHLPSEVRSCEADGEGVRVHAEFGDIVEDDQRAIAQFVRDLRLLKDEIRTAGDG